MTRGTTERASERRLSRRMRAGLLGLTVLLGVIALPSVPVTEARFTDSEYTAATFTATTLAAPVITSCTVTNFLGTFTGVTIVWTSPYLLAQERLMINTTVIPNTAVVQSGSGPYTYTAALTSSQVSTGLLGATNTIKVDTVAGTAWASTAATRTLSVGGLLGLGGNNTCT